MSTKRGLIRAFGLLTQFGLRPPDGWDDEVSAPLWANSITNDDEDVWRACGQHALVSKWWPTLSEFVALLPRVQPRRVITSSPTPTYDALPVAERARIGEIVVANRAIRWNDDIAIDAECERLAREVSP